MCNNLQQSISEQVANQSKNLYEVIENIEDDKITYKELNHKIDINNPYGINLSDVVDEDPRRKYLLNIIKDDEFKAYVQTFMNDDWTFKIAPYKTKSPNEFDIYKYLKQYHQ